MVVTTIIPKGSSLGLKALQRPHLPAFSSAAHTSQFNLVGALASLLTCGARPICQTQQGPLTYLHPLFRSGSGLGLVQSTRAMEVMP